MTHFCLNYNSMLHTETVQNPQGKKNLPKKHVCIALMTGNRHKQRKYLKRYVVYNLLLGAWCNGSTRHFDCRGGGSNPPALVSGSYPSGYGAGLINLLRMVQLHHFRLCYGGGIGRRTARVDAFLSDRINTGWKAVMYGVNPYP